MRITSGCTRVMLPLLITSLLSVSCFSPLSAPAGNPLKDATPPADVTSLTATAGDAQVLLSWTPPSDADFASVEISAAGVGAITVIRGTNSRLVSGIVNGTTYAFVVKTVDLAGNKSSGSTISATPVAPVLSDTTPPANVTGLAATPGDAQVLLSWTPPADADFASVEISAAGVATQTVKSGVTSCLISGLANGNPCIFTVKSVDASGNKSAGTTISATPSQAIPPDTTPPAKVINLAAKAGSSLVLLSWKPPADIDFASVEISAAGLATTSVPAGTESCTVTGLANATAYIFTVRAVDFAGNRSSGITIGAMPSASGTGDLGGGIF